MINTSFSRCPSSGFITRVWFERGVECACDAAAHILVARLAIVGIDANVTHGHDQIGVAVGRAIWGGDCARRTITIIIVRETRAALRDARALWRARNKRAA